MKLSVDIDKALSSIDDIAKRKSKAVDRALKVAGMEFVNKCKSALGKVNSRYRRYQRGSVEHWSSRPGRSPNPDTGWLKSSVQLSRRRTPGSVFVVVGAKYGRALEFGTRAMRARPFIGPLSKALAPKFKRDLLKALRNVR